MSALLTVTVGVGLMEVLNLDDPGIRREMRIEFVEPAPKGKIRLQGDADAMRGLLSSCEWRGGPGFDDPLWYKRSARSAGEAVRKVLVAAGERVR